MLISAVFRPSRAPLAAKASSRLPIGSIRARGWLAEQLRLSADGLTGHLMEVWSDVGPESGWLGGKGENWERGPYYLRGLISLAYTTRDPRLIELTRPWVEWTLASQRDDGFFGPADNPDWWPRMPMLEALRWLYEASEDRRVLPFMSRYFRHQLAHLPGRPLEGWAKPRGGDNLDAVLWLYDLTGEAFLLELGHLLCRQTSDWLAELASDGPPSETFEFAHGVNRAMGLKFPVVVSRLSRDPTHCALLRQGWRNALAHHGQIQGVFSSDEFLHGTGSTQGAELCTIVELLSSFETALEIVGEPWIAQAMERIAYNALPAILTADHRGHQYFEQPNQVACTPGPHGFSIHHENDLLFGPVTGYGCCAANFHMGWPQLVNHLWTATPNGLTAMLFAPCEVRAEVVAGTHVTITEETAYPFDERVVFTIRTERVVPFDLTTRIPTWASDATVKVNGTMVWAHDSLSRDTRGRREADEEGAALVTTRRLWRDGDVVEVDLPMRVRLSRWERRSVAVERGPLIYALNVGEQWRRVGGLGPFGDYEVHPTTPWNYALELDERSPDTSFAELRTPLAQQPWGKDGASIRLRANGRRLPDWTLENGSSGPIPEVPSRSVSRTETLTLIPFGCSRLRVAMFPVVPPTES